MCGIVGFLGTNNNSIRQAKIMLNEMSNTLKHRGPDDNNDWQDPESQIFLSHRRLSILDLSINGLQPMTSCYGKYIITFNGEIYNHLKLRNELENFSKDTKWKGTSDTETLLAGFENWGIRKTIQKCEGMFSLAVWCRETKVLTLVRDRLGEKPLYYGWQKKEGVNIFLFGSELKALKKHSSFEDVIDRDSLKLYMRYGNVPAPHSIYKNIFKLRPGYILSVSLDKNEIEYSEYWSLSKVIFDGKSTKNIRGYNGAKKILADTLDKTVKKQMISDVPLGAFLSGGIDSSLVVSLMQKNSYSKINTFTVGFNEKNFNEAPYAKAISQHLGTHHTELYVSSKMAQDIIPILPDIYDEPFADSSQIPTYLISKLSRNDVKVALTGDGGDEVFSGYNRYKMASSIWPKIKILPYPIRKFLSYLIHTIPINKWNLLSFLIKGSDNLYNFGEKMHKGGFLLKSIDDNHLYEDAITHWRNSSEVVLNSNNKNTILSENINKFDYLSLTEKMMALDTLTYLSDDILHKVDRASMSVSLETRAPFLDKEVIDLAWQLPQSYKINSGVTKFILRDVLYQHVPKNLIERSKVGFGVPIGDWLRTSLKDWAEDLLDVKKMQNEGFFNVDEIRQKWNEHLNYKKNWQNHLWNVLMFQSWLRK
jgi:asparagine synthase (glutamine-hydrolysing)